MNNVGNGGVFATFQAPSGNALEDNEINLSFVGTVFVKLNAAGGLDGYQNRTADSLLAVTLPRGAPPLRS